nr:hypothetical protein [Tanacetum cinerariifolium]
MVNRVAFEGVYFATFFSTAPLCDNCSQLECYWPLSKNAGCAPQESRQEFKNFLRKKRLEERIREIMRNMSQNNITHLPHSINEERKKTQVVATRKIAALNALK